MMPLHASPTMARRRFLGATLACGLIGSAGATSQLPPSPRGWPGATPAWRYRDATRQPILAAAVVGKRIVAAGMRGVVLYSDDAVSYKQASVPVSADLSALAFIDESHGWAVGNDGVVLATQDGGITWQLQRQAFGSDERLFSVMFHSRSEGMAVGAFGLALQTRDGGAHWDPVEIAPKDDSAPHLYQLLPGKSGGSIALGEFGLIFMSTASGVWNPVASPVKNSLFSGAVCGDALVAVGLQGAVISSHDGGANWRTAHVENMPNLVAVITNQVHQPVLLDARGGLIYSCDAGQHFSHRVQTPSPAPACAVWLPGKATSQIFGMEGVVTNVTSDTEKSSKKETACIV